VVYKIINMLVYFEPAALCGHPTDILIAPLPTKKELWEAGSESLWKLENDRHLGLGHDFALASNGDLIKLNDGELLCDSGSDYQQTINLKPSLKVTEDWGEWCSGMDGFGGLVMLAASMCE
jgi:hypothetical protein